MFTGKKATMTEMKVSIPKFRTPEDNFLFFATRMYALLSRKGAIEALEYILSGKYQSILRRLQRQSRYYCGAMEPNLYPWV